MPSPVPSTSLQGDGGDGSSPAGQPIAEPASTPLGIGAAVAAVCVWGVGNTLIAGVALTGTAIAFYRLALASVLYPAVLYARGSRLSRDSFRFGWVGGVAFGADIVTFFVAIHLTTVANATTINALQPLVIMGFAAVMFGERIRPWHLMCAFVATAGVAMVAFGSASSGDGSRLGDVMAVASLFAWAWYFIASKKARIHLDTFEYLTVMNLVAFAFVTPIALLTGDLFRAGNSLDLRTAGMILLIVVVPGSGHILINWAHGHTTLVMTSLVTLAMPVISATSAAIFLDQAVSGQQATGIALVLAALAAVIIWDARTTAGSNEPLP